MDTLKILHTSDWHLGQHFYTRHRRREHRLFLDWLLETVQRESVDAVIVAGDIFDTSTPPSYARELYHQFVVDISATQCQLILVAGNHDSVAVLNESKTLLKQLNTHVVSQLDDDIAAHLVDIKNKAGELAAIVTAVPFIRARDLLQSQAGESGLQKRQALGEAIKHWYQEAYEVADTRRETLTADIPIIMTGHLSALGVSQSDSVRDIYVGSLDGFPVADFPPADYVALGHIHKAQQVAGRQHICYSGSPIALSFDELRQEKTVNMLEFEGKTLQKVALLPIPVFQEMRQIKGDLHTIEQAISAIPDELAVWLSIEVAQQDFLSDLQQRIQTMTEGKQAQVLQLTRARKHYQASLASETLENLSEVTPMEVFERRLAMESMTSEEEQCRLPRLRDHFQRIETQLQEGEAAQELSDKEAGL